MTLLDRLAAAPPTGRLGLGLAAVGRPAYINVGHDVDLPPERSVPALRERAHELLDEAYARGVRYVDVARSYGRAEEFLAEWLDRRGSAHDVVVGSKWGYAYTADWRVDVDVHEVKDHSVAMFDRQFGETGKVLGARLDLYQIHSVTPDSAALTDTTLHRRLAGLAARGITVGVSTSGPAQRDAIRAALEVTVDGVPLFRSVQATWNPLDPSAGPALAAAHAAGCLVIVKEALANGRLAGRTADAAGRKADAATTTLAAIADELTTTPDAVALAAALHQPWATIVLSGAATIAHLASNLRAGAVLLRPDHLARLDDLAEPAERYWHRRSGLPWT